MDASEREDEAFDLSRITIEKGMMFTSSMLA
jgi:hypothetical protein